MDLYSRIRADFCLFVVLVSSIAVAANDLSKCPPIVGKLHHYIGTFGDYCYTFVNEEKYWRAARSYCWNNGGEMLEIDDEATMIFIRSTLNSDALGWRRNGVWLGAHDQHKEGHWIWSSNKPMKYDYWASDQPKTILGLSIEDCACMRKADDWRWHDCPCELLGWKYNFICQYPFNIDTEVKYHTGSEDSGHQGRGANIAIAVVSICLLLLLLCIVFLVYRRRRQRKKPNKEDEPPQFENLSYAQLRQGELEGAEPDAVCFTANQMNSLYEEVSKPVNHGVNYYSNMNGAACAESQLTPKVTNLDAAKENNATNEKPLEKPPPVKIVNNQLYDLENKVEGATAAPAGTTAALKGATAAPEASLEDDDHHYEDDDHHYEDMN